MFSEKQSQNCPKMHVGVWRGCTLHRGPWWSPGEGSRGKLPGEVWPLFMSGGQINSLNHRK